MPTDPCIGYIHLYPETELLTRFSLRIRVHTSVQRWQRSHGTFVAVPDILILARWNPLFAYLPVESMVHEHQAEYYQALQDSAHQADAAPFVEFMIRMILGAVTSALPTDQVTRLLDAIGDGQYSGADLMRALGLSHLPTFRKNYLNPALQGGLIERTQPDSPRSPTQRYRLTDKGRLWFQQRDGY